ncbi:MAG: FAD-dependent oxidoreductase [Opitutae bacterium]|nr:FAD-dependent oxidoreductase [Opitutae bacterium]
MLTVSFTINGTPASFAATLQAARMGKRAILVSNNGFVGGLTTGGLTAVDWGARHTIGGIAKEFFDQARPLTPSVAERTFLKMLSEAGVVVLLDRFLTAVETEDGKLVSITLETGEAITAKVFVDGTYEGDLLAAANVSYTVGREPRSAYNESLAGQWQKVSWEGVYQFCGLPISPYIKPGDPSSGLLPEISSEPYGKPGDGDHRIQAYNFRMHLTKARDRIAFPKPEGYDADRYALLARFLNIEPRPRWTLNYTTKPMTDGPVQMKNGDSNNAGSFSSDYVGGCHRWPDGTYSPENFSTLPPPRRGLPVPLRELYELREKIFQDHVNYQQGLMYFLANDKQVPKELQARVNQWGLPRSEFKVSGHWPHHLYVREGRRMVSDYVMVQANCENKRMVKDSVGIASYAMDSHFCQRVVVQENGVTTVRNEGGFGHHVKPYPVSYRSIVPKKDECSNLLVPLCLSASHVAYGSIRMEPVFMILGQSAGTAAVMAMDEGIVVQDVDYTKLKARLLADKQKL